MSTETPWQPIETAPKDEEYIILFRPGWANAICVGWWNHTWESWVQAGSDNLWADVTHWMPLPPAPKA